MPDDRDDDTREDLDPAEDDTQLMTSDDEPTRFIPASDEQTQIIGRGDDVTRRMDRPSPGDAAPTRRISPATPAAAPATERLPVARRGGAPAWLIPIVVVLALVAGGLVGYTQREPSGGNVSARALVGPDGGVITFDGTGTLTVPRGALPTATAITVRRETIDRRVRLGAEGDPRSVVYEPGELVVYAFEPSTLRFQQPVLIELPRRDDGSAVLVDSEDGARVIQAEVSDDVVVVETTSFRFDS